MRNMESNNLSTLILCDDAFCTLMCDATNNQLMHLYGPLGLSLPSMMQWRSAAPCSGCIASTCLTTSSDQLKTLSVFNRQAPSRLYARLTQKHACDSACQLYTAASPHGPQRDFGNTCSLQSAAAASQLQLIVLHNLLPASTGCNGHLITTHFNIILCLHPQNSVLSMARLPKRLAHEQGTLRACSDCCC